MTDERFLRQLGATSEVRASDPHAGCMTRWLDERDRREMAERSIQANAQAYEVLTEVRDREIERLRGHRTLLFLALVAMAAALFVALVR
jgi:hypothetical protein